MWSGWRLTRKQLTSRPDHFWPELWEKMGKNTTLKEKQKWSHEQLHLENARKLRGIYVIDRKDKELKETIKNARKKLETSVAPALPCKVMEKNCGSGGSHKVKKDLRVFWKLMNLQDCVWEIQYRIIMRTILQEKETIQYRHYNMVHKFIPMPQAMKIPAAKAAVDKEWENWRKFRRGI